MSVRIFRPSLDLPGRARVILGNTGDVKERNLGCGIGLGLASRFSKVGEIFRLRFQRFPEVGLHRQRRPMLPKRLANDALFSAPRSTDSLCVLPIRCLYPTSLHMRCVADRVAPHSTSRLRSSRDLYRSVLRQQLSTCSAATLLVGSPASRFLRPQCSENSTIVNSDGLWNWKHHCSGEAEHR